MLLDKFYNYTASFFFGYLGEYGWWDGVIIDDYFNS